MKRWWCVVVISLLVSASWACYGHAPTQTARQLDAGEMSVSGQLRVPGWFLFPGVAGVAQYGVGGVGDVGLQAGVAPFAVHRGLPNAFGGLSGRLYPTSSLMIGVEGAYTHVFEPYDQGHYDLVTPDFDHNFAGATTLVAMRQAGDWRWYGGLKGQVVVWVPDGARGDYPDLDPFYKTPQLAGFNAGALGGMAYDFDGRMSLQIELMALPVGVERTVQGDWAFSPGTRTSGNWGGAVARTGDPLSANRFQMTYGVHYAF